MQYLAYSKKLICREAEQWMIKRRKEYRNKFKGNPHIQISKQKILNNNDQYVKKKKKKNGQI